MNKNHIYGIQGGPGSFSEEALLRWAEEHKVKDVRIKYLYTSEKVLRGLERGLVDHGLFAVHNVSGGMVWESIAAMGRYRFKILAEIKIPVRHCLMKRKDVPASKIGTIMAHDQVFLQCARNLARRYPKLKQMTGKGDLVDTARAAWALSRGRVKKATAILGSRRLAEIHDFDILAEDLQDDKENETTFLMVGSTSGL